MKKNDIHLNKPAHYIYEIEDYGEFGILPFPICNGISLQEKILFQGTYAECLQKLIKLENQITTGPINYWKNSVVI